MSEQLDWIPAELKTMADEGLLRHRREVRPLGFGLCLIDGHEVWDFASNDYLNLAEDPRVVTAATEAIVTHGTGAKASPLVSGRTDLHARLEQSLAEFEGTESAILFPSGTAANIGTISTLSGKEDAVYCDRLNHASLIDGCRLSGAKLRVYRHDDLSGLKRSLKREVTRRKFIVTDTVFSMDGDLAPLRELCDIADEFDATLIVDEAHATGVFGSSGHGVAEMLEVEERIPVRIGTLSKAIGSLGGFVAGSKELTDYLWNRARTQVYSTALPPSVCAAALAALNIIRDEPSRRERLQSMALKFRDQIRDLGISSIDGSVGPIVPIVLKSPDAAMNVASELLSRGFLVGAIRPPTVPKGTSRLRITLHSQVQESCLIELANAIKDLVSRQLSSTDYSDTVESISPRQIG